MFADEVHAINKVVYNQYLMNKCIQFDLTSNWNAKHSQY